MRNESQKNARNYKNCTNAKENANELRKKSQKKETTQIWGVLENAKETENIQGK